MTNLLYTNSINKELSLVDSPRALMLEIRLYLQKVNAEGSAFYGFNGHLIGAEVVIRARDDQDNEFQRESVVLDLLPRRYGLRENGSEDRMIETAQYLGLSLRKGTLPLIGVADPDWLCLALAGTNDHIRAIIASLEDAYFKASEYVGLAQGIMYQPPFHALAQASEDSAILESIRDFYKGIDAAFDAVDAAGGAAA